VQALLKLLIDTCVWIDLAKDHHQHAILRALDRLVKEKKVLVLVPPLVRHEFQRNKGNIVERNRQSLSAALKRAKDVLDQHGEPASKAQALEGLNYVDQRLPRLGDLTGISAFVEQLLRQAQTIPITDAAKLRAADRAIAKKAPFHRNKNSVADAMLIEAFAEAVRGKDSKGHRFGFVTHNKNDFSVPDGDTRQHHPDFADIFTRQKVRYFTTLKDALLTVRSDVLDGLEFEEYSEQPRPTDEIVELIGELTDKMWYNHHLLFRQEVEEGRETCDPQLLAGAIRCAKNMERKYGRENLGPYPDFDWGMMLGKLSALRWALGEDWETSLDN
jgi:hypothetical protein